MLNTLKEFYLTHFLVCLFFPFCALHGLVQNCTMQFTSPTFSTKCFLLKKKHVLLSETNFEPNTSQNTLIVLTNSMYRTWFLKTTTMCFI